MAFGKKPFGKINKPQGLSLPNSGMVVREEPENLFAEKTPFYLVMLDCFRNFFEKRGVDYKCLRLILQVKMAVNQRALQNPMLETNKYKNRKQKGSKSLWKGMILQGIFGILFSLLLLIPMPSFSVYFLLYSVFFVLFIALLIPQLAQVFLSSEDAQVLPVRPVEVRVLSLAKVLQVSLYYAMNYVCYIVPSLIVGVVKRGIVSALLAIPSSFLLSAFALLFALALYLLVAKFFSGEKLRNMITYVQILLSMFSFAMYQMIAPLMTLVGTSEMSLSPWMLIWPPTWFVAPFSLITQTPTLLAYLATALGILSVVTLAVLYFMQSGRLEQRLQDLALQKDGEDKETGLIREFFAKLLCRTIQERAYFRFSWQMMRHERSFKTTVYPLLVTYAAMPYLMMLSSKEEAKAMGIFMGMPSFFLYMSIIGIANVLLSMQMSDYAEAAWLFRVLPQKSDGALATALAKSVWARLYVPLFLVQFPLQYVLNGRQGVLSIAILFFLSYLVTQGLVRTMPLVRPFTQKRTIMQADGCSYVFVLFGLWIVFAFLQGFLHVFVPWGVEIYVGVLALLSVLLIVFYRGKKEFRDA